MESEVSLINPCELNKVFSLKFQEGYQVIGQAFEESQRRSTGQHYITTKMSKTHNNVKLS